MQPVLHDDRWPGKPLELATQKRTALALSAAGLTVSLADPLDQVADDLGDELGILPVQVVATVVCHDMCV
jgi:hypothetical protein